MEPMVTAERIVASADVVIPVVVLAMVAGIVGVVFRKALIAAVDELAELWRSYAPIAAGKALKHRPGMPETPWFCDRCHSRNSASATRCYSCDARREEAEAAVPDALAPAGASAGLSTRTRRRG